MTHIKSRVTRTLFAWLREAEAREREASLAQRKAGFKKCGQNTRIHPSARIRGEWAIEMGDNVHIGENAFIAGEGGLSIGDNTHISRNLLLYTANHDTKGARLPYDDTNIKKPVSIGRNVWIGMNVCIAPGTQIGDGAIVAMGTTVSGQVPPMAVVGSAKWRILGERDAAHYRELDEAKLWGGKNGRAWKPKED